MNRVAATMLAFCLAAPARAGAQGVVPRDSTDTTSSTRIPAVVVTGARLDLRRTPLAVSTLDADEMRAGRAGLALDEALRAVPGVQVDNRFNYAVGERIAIRGFGARSQFGVRGIRVVIDGIPATLPDGQTNLGNIDLGILGRAQVIRGPAAALYGNASGGVLYFETEAAAPEPVAGRVRLTGGSGEQRIQSVLSGTNGRSSYLVSASRLEADGSRAHDDATVANLTGVLRHAFGSGIAQLVVSGVDYDARNPGSLSDSLLRLDRTQAFRNNVVQKTGERGRQGQVGLRWLAETGAGPLEVSIHALARDVDNPIPPRIIDLARTAGGARVVLQGARESRVMRGGWSAGVESQLQRDERLNFVNDSGRRAAVVLDQRERVTAFAPFARIWAESRDGRFSFLGGVRHDRQRFSADDALLSATNPDDSGERTMSAWSPSAGLSAELAPGIRLYTNVGTSFETPTTSELANRPSGAGGFNPELEPQRTRSIEGGMTALLNGVLALEAALYRARVRDALISFEVPGAPGRQFFRNSGAATHRGAELSLRTPSDQRVALRAAYSYISARFESGTSGATGLAGRRIPGVAPHRLDGTVELAPARFIHVAADVRYASSTPADDANLFFSPAYAVTDARVWMATRGSQWLAPFAGVRNVFARAYNASVVINAVGRRYFEPGPGRTVYLGIEGRWARDR